MNPSEKKTDNEMRRQALAAPALLLKVYPRLEQATRSILSTPEIYEFKRIILTGCGDCHAVALAARQVFEQLIGNRAVECIPPLDLARYYPTWKAAGEGPGETLVLAMSNSGGTPRVVEAATRMRKFGARVVALTQRADSPLANAADKYLAIPLPKQPPAPGTASYATMLLACHLLAIRFGEVRLRYHTDEASACRQDILQLLKDTHSLLPQWDETALAFARQNESAMLGEFVGSGCEAGTAYYAMAKLYEAAGVPAVALSSEEWFHIHCFSKQGQNTLTMLFADKDNSAQSRVEELAKRLGLMGRSFAVAGDAGIMEPDFFFALPWVPHSFFRTLVLWLPPALVAAHLAEMRKEPYHRGFAGIWKEDENTPSSWNSKIEPAE